MPRPRTKRAAVPSSRASPNAGHTRSLFHVTDIEHLDQQAGLRRNRTDREKGILAGRLSMAFFDADGMAEFHKPDAKPEAFHYFHDGVAKAGRQLLLAMGFSGEPSAMIAGMRLPDRQLHPAVEHLQDIVYLQTQPWMTGLLSTAAPLAAEIVPPEAGVQGSFPGSFHKDAETRSVLKAAVLLPMRLR